MTKIIDITRRFHFYSCIVGLVVPGFITATISSRTVGRIVTDPINFDSTEITSIEYPGLSSPQCLVILLSQPETFKTFCQLPTGGCILLSAAFPTNFNDTSEGHGYVCYTTSTPLIDRGRTWYMNDTESMQATPRTDRLQVASCSGRNSQTTENWRMLVRGAPGLTTYSIHTVDSNTFLLWLFFKNIWYIGIQIIDSKTSSIYSPVDT